MSAYKANLALPPCLGKAIRSLFLLFSSAGTYIERDTPCLSSGSFLSSCGEWGA